MWVVRRVKVGQLRYGEGFGVDGDADFGLVDGFIAWLDWDAFAFRESLLSLSPNSGITSNHIVKRPLEV